MNLPRYNPGNSAARIFSDVGVNRFRSILEYSEKCGVKACFENVEFPHLELKLLLHRLKEEGYRSLGFTWDVGHEHCYPAPFDVSIEFGELLTGTHFHDNFGQKNSDTVTWDDDLHLMPFDGNLDYNHVANRLKALGFQGTVTLEIGKAKGYEKDSLEAYLSEANARAARIAAMATD